MTFLAPFILVMDGAFFYKNGAASHKGAMGIIDLLSDLKRDGIDFAAIRMEPIDTIGDKLKGFDVETPNGLVEVKRSDNLSYLKSSMTEQQFRNIERVLKVKEMNYTETAKWIKEKLVDKPLQIKIYTETADIVAKESAIKEALVRKLRKLTKSLELEDAGEIAYKDAIDDLIEVVQVKIKLQSDALQ